NPRITPVSNPADSSAISAARPAAVTTCPEIASCTAPITESPDSNTVMLAAMTSDDSVPGGSAPTAKMPSVAAVARRPPDHLQEERRGTPAGEQPTDAVDHGGDHEGGEPTVGVPPSSTATAAASPAQPAVATHRG